ncbi:hypothetical protein AWB85_24180 [Mycobacteroides immunogenum]|uniref:GTPase-associated system helical domain-containing protein n=1 Tax=Mycobacteroides immunogenum TaxID=83262 RepID=A0A179V9T6_9MYCO|nr:GTPase-associated system all-helical protein GASH [Mycobacteroides immunogenum]OAT68669.1 hypothetical protein AWB85_24180 [Mycobacteroides immunogenum]
MDLIGDLLRAGLLTQIGEGEDRVEMIRSATGSLAKRFASDLRPLVPHAVVAAIDETSAVGLDPMQAADEALVTEWVTCRNVFPEPPAEILRAMLVSAVAAAATTDPRLCAAGWYSIRSAIELLPASRWAAPLTELAKTWDDAVWESVAQSWSPEPASTTLRMPTVPKFDDETIEVNTPARDQAQTFVDSGNYQNFMQTMHPEYVNHVNSLLGASESLAALSHKKSLDALRTFSADLGTKLREALAAHESSIESMRLRSDLIWWQQTSFSPSRRVGYSVLAPEELPLVAAVDLHSLLPAAAPLAAEHLLQELVSRVSGGKSTSIEELSAAGVDLPSATGYQPASPLDSIQSGVISPLLARSKAVETGRIAVLIFRDLQARRLSEDSTPGAS